MKKMIVTMVLEMSVPDDWELVRTSGDTDVVSLPDGTFLDLAFEPLVAGDPEDEWTSSDDTDWLDRISEMVQSEDVQYRFEPQS